MLQIYQGFAENQLLRWKDKKQFTTTIFKRFAMSAGIQKKLEELSLLLVMTDAKDDNGMDVVKFSFEQLGEEIKKAAD